LKSLHQGDYNRSFQIHLQGGGFFNYTLGSFLQHMSYASRSEHSNLTK